MTINDNKEAESFLHQVSYYRFSGYALHFEKFEHGQRTHIFKKGTCFEDIISLYNFDSELRQIIFSVVEDIEVAFKTQLCYRLAIDTNDSHWQLNTKLFRDSFDHKKFLLACEKEVERSREIFITHYKNKYKEPRMPASWMLIEIVSFGTWSRMFFSLVNKDLKNNIAKYFNLSPYILGSWIHFITIIRNLCAHHVRLWDRSITINPKLTSKMKSYYSQENTDSARIVIVLDIISELLKPLGKYELFIATLNSVFKKYPNIPIKPMGLTQNSFTTQMGVRQ